MKRFRIFLTFGLCIAMLGGCTKFTSENDEVIETEHQTVIIEESATQPETTTDTEEDNTDNTVYTVDMLTLEQKVGQLFIVRPDALDTTQSLYEVSSSDSEGRIVLTDTMIRTLEQYPVGGVCFFSKNISTPDLLKLFTDDLQSVSEIPLFLTVDEEGGLVARLANNEAFDLPQYSSAADVAASGNPEDAKDMGQTIGGYLKEYGFNMDFAPDADVNTNPDNPIIGTRAFSSDAETAAQMVAAAAEGFRESGILPTLKHFPGHGDTAEDSHTSLAVTYKILDELEACEFLPFESDTGMHAVMVGHIAAPNITGNDLPATLSEEMIDRIPNKENTLIITDSLEMQAISDTYSSGEAAVLAFEAGCDILLMPMDLSEAYNAILEAVRTGRISEERLDESVSKILAYKAAFVY